MIQNSQNDGLSQNFPFYGVNKIKKFRSKAVLGGVTLIFSEIAENFRKKPQNGVFFSEVFLRGKKPHLGENPH